MNEIKTGETVDLQERLNRRFQSKINHCGFDTRQILGVYICGRALDYIENYCTVTHEQVALARRCLLSKLRLSFGWMNNVDLKHRYDYDYVELAKITSGIHAVDSEAAHVLYSACMFLLKFDADVYGFIADPTVEMFLHEHVKLRATEDDILVLVDDLENRRDVELDRRANEQA